MSKAMFNQMRKTLEQWVHIPDDLWPTFAAIFQPQTYRSGSHLLYAEDVGQDVFFICQGLVRFYYLSTDGQGWNKTFVTENGVAGSSFLTYLFGQPSPFSIQALEDTSILRALYPDFEALYDQHHLFERLGRRFVETVLIEKEMREQSFFQQNATDRYLDFIVQYPNLVERLPQYHIASYLGISEASLSRIRRNLTPAQRNLQKS